MKPLLNKYFEYTRAERRGVSILILLCTIVWLCPYFLPILFPKSTTDFSSFDADIAQFEESQRSTSDSDEPIVEALFFFNPNTVNKEELIRLGVPEKVAHTFIKYRSSFGLFENKLALKNVYGFNDALYQKLEPYIQLENTKEKIASVSTIPDKISSPRLFNFDPNTASEEELKQLGMSSKTIKNILSYRAAKGKFYAKEDLKKIYTLSQKEYERLKDYIHILSTDESPAIAQHEVFDTNQESPSIPTSYDAVVSPKIIIDINKATEEEWQQLRGIGPTYAARIVKFRAALGGFHSVTQVAETYNFPDSTFQSIQLSLRPSPIIRTLRINEMNAAELKSHPYLNWKTANLLINYRDQHGNFDSIEDLKKVKGLSEETLNKIAPYLAF